MSYRTKDVLWFLQKETTFNVEPDAVAAGDAALTRTPFPTKRIKARLDRDKDLDRSAFTFTTQGGREKSDFNYENAALPAGVTTTPTAPDGDVLHETHFGAKLVHSAHSTTVAGSTGTTLNLATGGAAAMGVVVGDIIFVNVDATFGIEARQVRALAGDVVTMCRALSASPAAARAVYGSALYKQSQANMLSFRSYNYVDGNNERQATGGINPNKYTLSASWSGETTEVQEKFSGVGAQIAPYATAMPTPTLSATAVPLVTNQGKVWLGTAKACINKVELTSDNGIVLVENGSCGKFPTGLKRTGNDGKFLTQLAIDYTLETQAHFDAADDLTAIDTLVQLGDQLGNMVAFVCRNWRPDVDRDNLDGLVGDMLKGRCYATVAAGADEVVLAFG